MTLFREQFADPAGPRFAIDSFVGFRGWRVDRPVPTPDYPRGGGLSSITQDYQWTPGVNQSKCDVQRLTKDHDTHRGMHTLDCFEPRCDFPTRDCQCGFYAYFEKEYFLPFGRVYIGYAPAFPIYGVVSSWGRCVKGTRGFRAQFARIDALAMPPVSTIPDLWLREYDQDAESLYTMTFTSLSAVHPTVPIFGDVDSMLERFPLSQEG